MPINSASLPSLLRPFSLLRALALLLSFAVSTAGVLGAGGAAAEESSPTSLDVVFVIDNSGSMKKNDPGFLTRSVVQKFSAGLATDPRFDARVAMVLFDDDPEFQKGVLFVTEAVERGVYLHPFHNMFLCAAHTRDEVATALERTDEAFGAVRRALGT